MKNGALESLTDLVPHQGRISFNLNTRSLLDSHLRGRLSLLDLMSVR